MPRATGKRPGRSPWIRHIPGESDRFPRVAREKPFIGIPAPVAGAGICKQTLPALPARTP